MQKIKGTIKNYNWGTTDYLAELLGLENKGETLGEYWMGQDAQGNRTRFLFKVLSINKPLSIQCHPSDEQAEKGFEEKNPNYSSPFGKPEIICALTPLVARCGIKDGVSKEEVIDILENHQNDLDKYLDKIMNKITLQPGEAVFIEAGVLHQYISGNGVELMNWSDNVIRGGMTSKYVDIEELKKIGRFENSKPCFVSAKQECDGRIFYNAPCDKFELRKAETGEYKIKENMDTLAIVIEGSAKIGEQTVKRGECIFIEKDSEYDLKVDGCVFFAR